jgi:hypothetical protein
MYQAPEVRSKDFPTINFQAGLNWWHRLKQFWISKMRGGGCFISILFIKTVETKKRGVMKFWPLYGHGVNKKGQGQWKGKKQVNKFIKKHL